MHSDSSIFFHYKETDFRIENLQNQLVEWVSQCAETERFVISNLNYIFCSDEYLLQINKDYLNHDTYTDIVTFDNSEEEQVIEGDLFISIDRVKENALAFKVTFNEELCRVMIHGVLHLMGYKDKTDEEKKQMRAKEDFCLSKYN